MKTLMFLACFPLVITFSDLKENDFENKKVQIRGFAYQLPEGDWVLSSKPYLKSCCLIPSTLIQLENVVEKLPQDRVITIKGRFYHNHEQNNEFSYFINLDN